ncbi:MAG: LppX_LprAFG lipoprotein, partial [Acidimicrobiales bacterium]
LVVFESASGRFAAPRSADAVVAVDLMGNRVELGAVALDGVLYLTDPLTGAWQDATGTIDFDPATIFSVDEGIAAVLASGMADTSLRTAEPDDDGLLHLTGTVSPDDVATLTSGLVSEPATAEVSIDAATSLVRTITFDTPLDNGVASWLVELSDYGADVTIEPPDLGDG